MHQDYQDRNPQTSSRVFIGLRLVLGFLRRGFDLG